jgi:hypothetical protein
LRAGEDPLDRCRALVGESDILIAIIDDTVSEPVAAEIREAEKRLGRSRMSYFFVRDAHRDTSAVNLRERVKNTHVLVEPQDDAALRDEVGKSIASYLDDAVRASRRLQSTLLDKVFAVQPGYYVWESFQLRAGDRIVATCNSSRRFYGRLMTRESFVRWRNSGADTGMSFGSDGPSFTAELVADREDEWYIGLKFGIFNEGTE